MKGYSKYFWFIHFIGDVFFINIAFVVMYYFKFDSVDFSDKYRFLITLIHEISHYFTFKNYGIYIKPHGVEWKNTFRSLLLPVINSDVFPNDVLKTLAAYTKNPKASTDTDLNLYLTLNKYNTNQSEYVSSLSSGTVFKASNDRTYIMIKKLRKRYECMDVLTKKLYLFSPNVKIKEIINE